MEEVDNIIIVTLKQLSSPLPVEITSLKQFTPEHVVDGVARCLTAISQGKEFPNTLPKDMSTRFRIGTNLATACQELGYPSDIGYHLFLYPNEDNIRKLFIWLVERLPKESSEAVEDPLGPMALLMRTVGAEVKRRLDVPWVLPMCKKRNGVAWRGQKQHKQWHMDGAKGVYDLATSHITVPGSTNEKISKESRQYYDESLPLVTAQPKERQDVAPSVLEYNVGAYAYALEWDQEWNTLGLDSGLTKAEYLARKRQQLQSRMAEQLRASALRADGDAGRAGASETLADLLSSFAEQSGWDGKGTRFTHMQQLQYADDAASVALSQADGTFVGGSEAGSGDAGALGAGESADKELSLAERQRIKQEELQAKREAELADLQGKLDGLTSQYEQVEGESKSYASSVHQLEARLAAASGLTGELEEAYKLKKRTFDLLPQAQQNIAQLQALIDASAGRLVELGAQWEQHRQPLVDQHRALKDAKANRALESRQA
eukprot:Colp12_sorted_trinity150504_noHs@17212